jgi:hypothetical protein
LARLLFPGLFAGRKCPCGSSVAAPFIFMKKLKQVGSVLAWIVTGGPIHFCLWYLSNAVLNDTLNWKKWKDLWPLP